MQQIIPSTSTRSCWDEEKLEGKLLVSVAEAMSAGHQTRGCLKISSTKTIPLAPRSLILVELLLGGSLTSYKWSYNPY